MYADKITDSMQKTMDETQRRRKKQIAYNFTHNITPTQAGKKSVSPNLLSAAEVTVDGKIVKAYIEPDEFSMAADPVVQYMNAEELKKQIGKIKTQMIKAAKDMNFVEAARLRDEMYGLEKILEGRTT
jgi:excinuclease ABC subunit B